MAWQIYIYIYVDVKIRTQICYKNLKSEINGHLNCYYVVKEPAIKNHETLTAQNSLFYPK